jgi:hypothetical protein
LRPIEMPEKGERVKLQDPIWRAALGKDGPAGQSLRMSVCLPSQAAPVHPPG